MKKDGLSQAFAEQTDLMKRKSEELASNLEKNTYILNELMSSDVSWLNLKKVSFQRERGCLGYREKKLKITDTLAYVEKGPVTFNRKGNKIVIPEAHYYESDNLLEGNKKSRDKNLIDNFSYLLFWTLQGEHKQTDDWHLFYRIGGFCGPGGIDATTEHASLYVLSGYEKFKKLEKICRDIKEKEQDSIDTLNVFPKMPFPTDKRLHAFAGLMGPFPMPEIKKMRKLMGISEIDESYVI